MKFETQFEKANARLKAGRIGVTIERSGERLALRATLPPKPESTKVTPSRQRIYLGVRANPAGLKVAEAEAKKIGGAIARGDFSWEPYIKVRSSTIGDWVEKFETDYFQRRSRTPASETTWKKDYQSVLCRLPPAQPIGAEILKSAILATPPDTKSRKRACTALGALARFAQIDFDVKPYKGSYSPSKVQPRDLPSDGEIMGWRDRFTNSSWQWAYGVLATFGLRPHELFHCESIDGKILTITDGKTGGRKVWACYPEWVEEWNLSQFDVPQVSGRTNSDLGHRVTQYFRRSGCPFRPYDLRHCWARRTLEFGLDVTLAAQQMGHSTKVHTDQYLAWIGDETHQRAYDALMQRPSRPRPPEKIIDVEGVVSSIGCCWFLFPLGTKNPDDPQQRFKIHWGDSSRLKLVEKEDEVRGKHATGKVSDNVCPPSDAKAWVVAGSLEFSDR